MRDRAGSVMTRALKYGAVLFLLCPVAGTAVNLASVTVTPTAIVAGSPVEVTVALDTLAPAGGFASSSAGATTFGEETMEGRP